MLGIDASRAFISQKTGVHTYAFQLLLNLARLAPEAPVLLYTQKKIDKDDFEMPGGWSERNLPRPRRLWTQARLSWEMWRRPPALFFAPAHVLPFVHPKCSALTIHDVAFEKNPRWYGRNERVYHRLTVKHAVKKAALIFTVSEFTKTELVNLFGAAQKRIVVTPLGVDRHRYYPELKEKSNNVLPQSFPYLLFVGRLEAKKNVSALLRVFALVSARHKDLRLVLVGIPGFGYEKIKEEVEKLKLKNRVIFLGYAAENLMPIIFAHTEALVFPSLYEGFGLPILEAMASGTPVVTSNRTATAEVAGSAACLINPERDKEIAEGIFRVLEDKNYAAELRQKGLARAAEFSWEKTAQKTWEALSRLF